MDVVEEGYVKLAKLYIHDTQITFIPLYLRGCNWQNEFNIVKNFFEENHITNPLIIGDLNIRIGSIQQNVDDFHMEMFKSGREVRRSKDVIDNKKGKQFMKFCLDENLFVLNGQTDGDDECSLTYVSSAGESVNDICAVHFENL